MWFGNCPTTDAEGTILAHSMSTPHGTLRKGRRLTESDVRQLVEAGHAEVLVARFESGDISEDDAASRVAASIVGASVRAAAPFTGRANIYAEAAGVALVDADSIRRLNGLDESLTVATVAPFERVEPGQMVATVKVITFAVPAGLVDAAQGLAAGAIAVAPFKPARAGLILTVLPTTKPTVTQKREKVISDRLASLGSALAATQVVDHETSAVADAMQRFVAEGLDPILVFAASAIVDRGDIVPGALVEAGGEIVHLGMPVDPGNLAMVGRLGCRDVIGVPSCAASPKVNGFDWLLERRLAGLAIGRHEIAAMGVGGLLKEIPSRPQPRELGSGEARRAPSLAAIVLAAGRSTRMGGGRNKLLEPLDGRPLVRHAVEAAIASGVSPVVVVTGHAADLVRSALEGLPVEFVHNERFAMGLSTSVVAGLAALPSHVAGTFIQLGDMPRVTAGHLKSLAAGFSPDDGRSVIVPVNGGKRGNPVLWGRTLFPAMREISGDSCARHLLGAHSEVVVEVDLATDAIFLDVDTPDALERIATS
jgi:molybdenum cofactor cytidylyltransferase